MHDLKISTSQATQAWKRPSGLKRCVLALAVAWTPLIAALTGCDSPKVAEIDLRDRIDDAELARMAPQRDREVLRFGFDLRSSPDEEARQYVPFLKYLERATGLRFELRFTPKGSDIVKLLGTGEFDFAAVGAGTYIQAHARHGAVILARGLNAEGRAEYRSVIVVAPDSPIRKIEELRGRRFAFGGFTSTQGHLIPRIILAERGISLDDLAGYEYAGSHQNCANAVAAGRLDAGGLQDLMGRRMAKDGLLRIIHTSGLYPSSGISASRDVPPDAVQKVKRALLDFRPNGAHAEGLYQWDRTEMAHGFTAARDEDYAVLREWTAKFGLLEAPAREEAP